MRPLATVAALIFLSACASAQGFKSCEELKADIAKKLEANHVTSYSLEIVANGQEADNKVVGSCEGGKKKITYSKTSTPAKAPAAKAPEAKAPAAAAKKH